MSREIKFRMWTGTIMLYDVSNVYECLKQQKAHDEGYTLSRQLGVIPYDHIGDGSLFLQYTGLKDKNGKEIFEGDIVRALYTDWPSQPLNDPRTFKQYQIDISKCGEVLFEGYEWCIRNGNNYGTFRVGRHGWIEVIGNIHEHPELLLNY